MLCGWCFQEASFEQKLGWGWLSILVTWLAWPPLVGECYDSVGEICCRIGLIDVFEYASGCRSKVRLEICNKSNILEYLQSLCRMLGVAYYGGSSPRPSALSRWLIVSRDQQSSAPCLPMPNEEKHDRDQQRSGKLQNCHQIIMQIAMILSDLKSLSVCVRIYSHMV